MTFPEFFRLATGNYPYPWQERIAAEGLPAAIDIETGAGKTAGVVLAWLHRLLRHPDPEVRASTPPWLVFALPMRSLVDQTDRVVRAWVGTLGDEVAVHRLVGGEGRVDDTWRDRPGQPTILVGTIDMILSRQLMRGYASSRWMWPVEFGLLHAGCHLVFDEVQLLGPALATSRQLEAFRHGLGTAAPCSSTWMSATLDPGRLLTVDNPQPPLVVTLGEEDRARGLERRLAATRAVAERQAADPKSMARVALDEHREGTLTLVVLNEVKRAQDTYRELVKLTKASDQPEVGLLHSRFRPTDRQEIVDRFVVTPVLADGPGRILVATQVVEAGVDISAATLLTDAAPWSSVVQRAGRCNRAGEYTDARLLWVPPARTGPYEEADLAASMDQLRALEGELVTSTRLRELGRVVVESEAIVAVLRKRDLVDLFDTSPDLVGNDIDISRFIRADGDTDVQVAWRQARTDEAARVPFEGGPIHPQELCRVPIGQARSWLKGRSIAWGPDHLAPKRRWRRVGERDVRAGTLLVVDAAAGGYDPLTGWDGTTKRPVPVVSTPDEDTLEVAPADEGSVDDPATFIGTWVTLDDHLGDTEAAARSLVGEAGMSGLFPGQLAAVVQAAALHDLGKAHDVFQDTLVRSAGVEHEAAARGLAPLAKSGGSRAARHAQPHFRHELVSALMLLERGEQLLDRDLDASLVRYLVAAHHGRVRLSIRSIPGETPPRGQEGTRVALGVVDGDVVPALEIRGVHLDPTVLRLDVASLGAEGSWTAMALALRDREDLGPFRLATLEALTRLADWRASATPSRGHSLDLAEAAS